ncbi:OLC1v1036565C1 [Oldenlandia corymbosa var. corymbosa]|uniref:OLC1v1036565C1 n=1 Tax=Oldenlandia corymbosa var. corymbosa TaxID=529605 RepID=A0AAV1CXN4_OLDCO|nr:OLC1v1036565C1 [Oldenlandia corymbosa var. corymbosa]
MDIHSFKACLKIWRKSLEEPSRSFKASFGSILSGAFIKVGVLTAGLISFWPGNSQLGQKLMRARVVLQSATTAIMVGVAWWLDVN